MASKATPLISFQEATSAVSSPALVATDHSLLELDSELDAPLDQIQDEIEEQGEASAEAMEERFQWLCQAMDAPYAAGQLGEPNGGVTCFRWHHSCAAAS
jgi:hypothetical protein